MKFKKRILLRDYIDRYAFSKANIQRISICLGNDELCRIECYPRIYRSYAYSVIEENDRMFSESFPLMNYFVKATTLNDGTDPKLLTNDRFLTIYLGEKYNYAD